MKCVNGEASPRPQPRDGKAKLKELWNKLTQKRAQNRTPRALKVSLWVFAGICALIILAMWSLVAAELALEDVDNPNPYRSGCLIGQPVW